MNQLAAALSTLLQSPVGDRTGPTGKYDFKLDVAPPLDSGDRDPQPRIIEAIRKLDLNIKSAKVTTPILVVEFVQKIPTSN